MSNFRQFDRATGFLLPPSLDEWLPERHLARFVVEVIDGLDLSSMVKSYRGSGSAGYHPALLLGLLVYGYTTGVFSSRKLERATYDSVAFRFIAANDHPDHDTIATFRRPRRTRRSVSIAPPKAGRGTDCARPELSVRRHLRRPASGIVTKKGGDASGLWGSRRSMRRLWARCA
jgi:Transposase domain (DUF772)